MIMDIDAVIIEAEFEIESKWRPFGHYINLRLKAMAVLRVFV